MLPARHKGPGMVEFLQILQHALPGPALRVRLQQIGDGIYSSG